MHFSQQDVTNSCAGLLVLNIRGEVMRRPWASLKIKEISGLIGLRIPSTSMSSVGYFPQTKPLQRAQCFCRHIVFSAWAQVLPDIKQQRCVHTAFKVMEPNTYACCFGSRNMNQDQTVVRGRDWKEYYNFRKLSVQGIAPWIHLNITAFLPNGKETQNS